MSSRLHKVPIEYTDHSKFFIFMAVARPKWKAWLRKTLTRFDNSWYHAKTELINCCIIKFLNNLPKKNTSKVWEHDTNEGLGRDDNPTSAVHIGYHVNFTRYVILIVCSRPIVWHNKHILLYFIDLIKFSRINPEFCLYLWRRFSVFSTDNIKPPHPPPLFAVDSFEKTLKFKSNTVFLLGSCAFLLYSISL